MHQPKSDTPLDPNTATPPSSGSAAQLTTDEYMYEWEAYKDSGTRSYLFVEKGFVSSKTAIGAAAYVAKDLLRRGEVSEWQPVAIDIGDQRFSFYGRFAPRVTWTATSHRPKKEGMEVEGSNQTHAAMLGRGHLLVLR